jgi:hypothetical protein
VLAPAASSSDPADPQVWWRLLVDAVAGLQSGNKFYANQYLEFTKQHRGPLVARAAKRNLIELADADGWKSCGLWPGWGYKPKPPAPPAKPKKGRK